MDKISLISSIMSVFENGVRNQLKNIMFIKYYNSFKVPVESIKRIESWGDVVLVHHRFTRDDMQTVAQPFLDTIRMVYKKELAQRYSPMEFVNQCGVYSLQKEAFASYLDTGIVKRNEDPIIVEVNYEIKRFNESMVAMLDYISMYKRLIFIIDDLQYADYATLQLINKLSDAQKSCSLSILASYNENSVIEKGSRTEWENLMEKANSENMIYDSDIDADETGIARVYDEFMPVSSKADEYIEKLSNMLKLLSLTQAEYYIERIQEETEKENIRFDDDKYIKLLFIFSKVYIYLRKTGQALQICEQISAMIDDDDYGYMYEYYYLSAVTQSLTFQGQLALKYVDKCKGYAALLEDGEKEFKAKVLYYIVIYYSWINVFFCDFNHQVEDAVLEEFAEHGYYNTRNYIMVYAFENDKQTLADIVSGRKVPIYFNRAVESGTELDNREFLLGAYMKNIILCTEYGFSKYVAELYKRRIQIVKKENTREREGHMYSGLGYNCIIDEQYAQANKYLNESLKINYEFDAAEKCADTLYNMALNCVTAGDYESAINACEIVLKLMECLDISGLDICNKAKIYGFMSLSQFNTGAYYNSYIYLDRMENALSHILECKGEPDYDKWDDEMFLYHLIVGMNYCKDGEYYKALEQYDQAAFHRDRSVRMQFYTVAALAIERAEVYYRLNRDDDAHKVLTEAIEFCNEKGYFHKTRLLVKKLENNREILSKWSLPITSINMLQISKMAAATKTRTELNRKNKEIGFLTTWQEVIGTPSNSVEKLISTAVTTLQNSYNLDGVIYISLQGDKPWSYVTDNNIGYGSDTTQLLTDYFTKHPASFVVNRGEKEFKDYRMFRNIIGDDKVATIIGVPVYANEKLEAIVIPYVNMHRNFTANKVRYKNDSLTILKFAFIQLCDAVERTVTRLELEKVNDMLSRTAITDRLTGIYNRQGLKNIIESEHARKAVSRTAVMYIDMDHFKYYNDTFGHQVGDEILKDFADRGTKLLGKTGYLVRYGGDEFIIILPDKNTGDAADMAVQVMECFDGINDDIDRLIQDDVKVPEDKKLSCSIGIAEFEKWEDGEVYAAFNRADEALYDVKRSTKNDFRIWSADR